MELIFEKYRIAKADDMNLVIEKKVIIGKGKNEGSEKWASEGYYGSLSAALSALLNKKLMESDVATINSMKERIEDIRLEILEKIDSLRKD